MMASKCKKIVLLQGLYPISDFHFRTVKSLMAEDLHLKGGKHEEYDRIKFADLMAEKFKSDAGLGKLIMIFKDITDLASIADHLRKEKAKVLEKMKCKGKGKNKGKGNKQEEPSAVRHTLNTNDDSRTESEVEVPVTRDGSNSSMHESDGPAQPKKKKKENTTKKTDDSRHRLEQETGLAPETSATTTALQSSPQPPPTPSKSASKKKKKNAVSTIDHSTKILDTKLPTTSTLLGGSCPPTVLKTTQSSLSCLHIPQVQPMPTHSQQSIQMPSATLSTPQQTPQVLTSTSSKRPRASKKPSVTPSCSLPTPETVATPHDTVQIFWMSPTTPSSFKIPQMPLAASRKPQKPRKPQQTSSTSVQTPQRAPRSPPSSTETLQRAPETKPCSLQTTQVSSTSSSSLQTLQLPQPPSSTFQTLQVPSPSPSSTQTTQRAPETLSSSLKTTQIHLPPPSGLQNTQILPETTSNSHTPMKPRLKCVPTEPSEETGYQPQCKEVVVLKVTEPFIHNFKEPENMMIHATVATENEFFRVKVFDMRVKDMFIPKNVLSISHYNGRDGFLEIYKYSAVSNVSADRNLNISSTLIKNANATPKISQICLPSERKYVNGIFTVHKKTVRGEFIYYEIGDTTGKMEVVVHGWLRNSYCEEGDKLNLTCFEVASSGGRYQLRSVLHSHLKVIKTRKTKIQPHSSNTDV